MVMSRHSAAWVASGSGQLACTSWITTVELELSPVQLSQADMLISSHICRLAV